MEKNQHHELISYKVKIVLLERIAFVWKRNPGLLFFDLDVPADVLEKIDEVISSVISGQGDIPIESETTRHRYQSRLSYTEQHNVICDSSYIPLNQENLTSQQYDYHPSSHESGRTVVAELISTILSNGASSSSTM
jgi:hypothetical protein